jgi:hypothetical protein
MLSIIIQDVKTVKPMLRGQAKHSQEMWEFKDWLIRESLEQGKRKCTEAFKISLKNVIQLLSRDTNHELRADFKRQETCHKYYTQLHAELTSTLNSKKKNELIAY